MFLLESINFTDKNFFFVKIIFAIIALSFSALKNPATSGFLEKAFNNYLQKQTNSKKNITGLTQIEADNLANDTFSAVNKYREEKGLFQLVASSDLCAYAQRRLEQLEKFGKYDDRKGFLEDTADSQLWKTYFGNYSFVNETTYFISFSTKPDGVVKYWGSYRTQFVNDKSYTDGCIRADSNFLQFIVGIKK